MPKKKSKNKQKSNKRRAGKNSGSSKFKAKPFLPPLFVKRIKSHYPEQSQNILSALEKEALTAIRINTNHYSDPLVALRILKDEHPEVIFTKIPWCPAGYYLNKRIDFTHDPLHHAGLYYVQEPASMIIGEIVGKLEVDGPWLDMCAAPGGKATHIATKLENQQIIANEADHRRVLSIIDNSKRLGLSNLIVTLGEGQLFADFKSFFSGVTLDAPCSGEGMFRKDPKSRLEWSEEKITECANLQEDLLSASMLAVKSDRSVIYSTCTFADEENENHFLKHDNPQWWTKDISISKVNALCFAPGITDSEGFYLRKFSLTKLSLSQEKPSFEKSSFPYRVEQGTELPEFLSNEIISKDSKFNSLYIYREKLIASYADDYILSAIESNPKLKLLHFGLELAERINDRWIPSHHLIMSRLYKSFTLFQETSLSKTQALAYLRGESIPNPKELDGYLVLTYNGQALGLGRATQGRINNLYPKYLRIKKKTQKNPLF